MKLLLDAHLPSSLVDYFNGHDVMHTSRMPLGNLTPDIDINAYSIADERIVITKDTDFFHSFVAKRQPYKLVLVKLGNMRLREIKSYFERNTKQLLELLENHSFLILEPDMIRILE